MAPMEEWTDRLDEWIAEPWVRPALILLGTVVTAIVLQRVVTRVLTLLAARTATDLDDKVVAALKRPIHVSVFLIGTSLLSLEFNLSLTSTFIVHGGLKTIAVVLWSSAGYSVISDILTALSARPDGGGFIQRRTIPFFEISLKAGIIALAVYSLFLAWEIDLTAWLASAGIIGIAVGFAAKDSLANLFAGLFIIADAPYRVGDYVVLASDSGGEPLRGVVTRIGLRSSRILTRDGIEIIVPNALIGNATIINESGGPSQQRVRSQVGVAYGTSADTVTKVLLESVIDHEHICISPAPEVRFKAFGDSSLDFEVLFWIDQPPLRDRILSDINYRIYAALAEANIQIPFPQRDLHIRSGLDPFKRSGG